MNDNKNELLNEYKLAIIDYLKDYDFMDIEFNCYKNNKKYFIDCYNNIQKLLYNNIFTL